LLQGRQGLTALASVVVFIGGFMVYRQTLGRLTDFPQLPSAMTQPMRDLKPVEAASLVREALIAAQRGFGPGCPELDMPLKLESRKPTGPNAVSGRGIGFYVYGKDYEILRDNPRRVRIWPFSLVYITAAESNDPDEDEISTVHGEEAILEFDRPIKPPYFSDVRPVAGWVRSETQDVELRTNRRTCTDKTDDISVFTDRLSYSQERNLIWADNHILVVAGEDTRIEGVGMELELHSPAKPGQPEPKHKHEARRVHLLRDVRFVLPVDDEANFLGPPVAKEEANRADDAKRVSPITITAKGRFVFDLERDHATFQDSVSVLRESVNKAGEESIDQLVCDRLELQFESDGPTSETTEPAVEPGPASVAPRTNEKVDKAARPDSQKRGRARQTRPLRLLNATATAVHPRNVLLQAESQQLMATGNRLFHDTKAREATLSGEKEMIAVHDNTIIHARLLKITQGETSAERSIIAMGPGGWLEILDESVDQPGPSRSIGERAERKANLTIRWQGLLNLSSSRDSETKVVVIDKNVELDDKRADGRGGAMTCDWLKVWLAPVQTSRAALDPGGQRDSRKSRRKLEPIALEARGNVSAGFPDLLVNSANLRMEILYPKDAPNADKEAPRPPSESPTNTLAAKGERAKANAVGSAGQADNSSGDPPLDVRANSVVVVVERQDSRATPTRAWAEGQVQVTQAARRPDDEPLRVHGQKLEFERRPAGDVLDVFGSAQTWARIEATEMTLAAKQRIHLDETTNRIHVTGVGYLNLKEVGNDLTAKPQQVPKPLRIDWDKSMDYDGKFAVFDGGVRAQQGPAEVRCQFMEVTFERHTVFKEMRQRREGNPADQSQIVTVVCDKDVVVYDQEIQDHTTVRYTSMRVAELQYNNLEGTLHASGRGRGVVRVIEPNPPRRDAQGRLVPPALPFHMTQVTFLGELRANNKQHLAKFLDNVRIVHAPIAQPDQVPDEDRLGPDSMTVSARDFAEMMIVENVDGAKHRDFRAAGNVRVQSREFSATCDRLSYSGAKDQLVFESNSGRKARFYKQDRIGAPATVSVARRVEYSRQTGDVKTDETEGFQSLDVQPRPASRPR
jgi:lipopolysaccharide export system protein LptA